MSNGSDHFCPEKKPPKKILLKMQWNGVRRAHYLRCCKTLTNNTHLHHAYIPVTMSSLEEPLAFDRIQRFSSGACRPRDDVGMGHRWIQGRDCSTSNCCSDDDKSFGKESFPWKRHTRKVSEGEILLRSISFSGRNSSSTVSGTLWESKSFQEHKFHTFSSENGISHSSNKVVFLTLENCFFFFFTLPPT